jgi:hypothetical protein
MDGEYGLRDHVLKTGCSVVDVDFGESAQDGQDEFSPGCSEIEILHDRDKTDVVLLKVVWGNEQPTWVAIRYTSINRMYDYDIKLTILSPCHQHWPRVHDNPGPQNTLPCVRPFGWVGCRKARSRAEIR